MDGLEGIIARIEEDALHESEDIINKAKKAAEDRLKDAEVELRRIVDCAYDEAEKQRLWQIEAATTKGEGQAKRIVLAQKQALIGDTIKKVKSDISNMNEKDYFEFLALLLKKYDIDEGYVIYMSADDIKRMTSEFKSELNKRKIKLLSNGQAAGSGFVLSKNLTEVNCTVEALFEEKKEKLWDELNKLYFKDGGGA